jgi:hypothetical protein
MLFLEESVKLALCLSSLTCAEKGVCEWRRVWSLIKPHVKRKIGVISGCRELYLLWELSFGKQL